MNPVVRPVLAIVPGLVSPVVELVDPPASPEGPQPVVTPSIATGVVGVVAPARAATPAPVAPAVAEDHAAPTEEPVAPRESTMTPGPALTSGASAGGAAAELESFGVRGPAASSVEFSPQGFSPPGAPTFDSDTTPD